MSHRLLLVLSLTCLAADDPLPSATVEPAASGSVTRIHNSGSQPLAAFVIEIVDYPGNPLQPVQDELWGKPVGPGETREMRIGAMMPGAVPDYLKVRAAV